jgi:hypothetical protein
MLNVWDDVHRAPVDDVINVSGLTGEALRTFYKQTANIRTYEGLEERFRIGWRFGSTGLLREDVKARLEEEARQWLFDDPTGDATPLELIDVFYIRHRLRRWMGTGEEVDRSNRVFPLYSLPGIRAAFAIGDARRRDEFLHNELMRVTAPELADWRVGQPVPSVSAVAEGPVVPTSGAAPPPAPGGEQRATRAEQPDANLTAHQRYESLTTGDKKRLLEEVLTGGPANPVFDIVDRERTLAAVAHMEELNLGDRVRLFGALTAAIWLGDSETP